MMGKDAADACGPRHSRGEGRRGYRWGRTRGKIAFHAGKMEIERPRVRDFAGRELALPSWEHAMGEDWLGKWAVNLMLLNVSTRKFRRAVRLPEGDVPAPAGSGVSKSAASRHFVALSSAGRFVFQALREIANQSLGLRGIVELPGLPQRAAHRSVQSLWQPRHNVAGLVNLAALDRRLVAKTTPDRPR
jgi:hypothetical protein